MRLATVVGLLTFVAALPPATAQRGTIPPRVTVETLVALPVSGGPQAFRVGVRIDNIGTEPLKIRELEFKLRLADQGILDGLSQVPLTIEALDRRTVTLDLRSDILSSVSRLMSFVKGPDNALPYEIYGTLKPDRRLREPIVFSAAGEVSLVVGAP
jgi:LEA14-like dessication related protein